MNAPQASIEAALIDVRKAFRLLHEYQQAAMDAAKYIGAQLGLNYSGGYPNFSNAAPRSGGGSLNHWSWDWLNMMFYDFNFIQPSQGKEPLHLSMWLLSDTGYFISDAPDVDRRPISAFAPVEKSGTKVAFLIYEKWEPEDGSFVHDKAAMRAFLETGGTLPESMRGRIVARCYDFADLRDEASTEQVISELIDLAQSANHRLERVQKLAK